MKRLPLVLLLLCACSAFAQVRFSGLDLSASNKLLFKATTDSPGNGSYDTLFLADVGSNDLTQLTFFPEKSVLIGNDERLQVQNRYGVFRTDGNLQNMKPVALFPSFVNGAEIKIGKISAAEASPDGRFLVYQVPISYGYAKLVLYDTVTQKESIISQKVEYSLSGPLVAWSPDSRYLVYGKLGSIYYYSINQLAENRVINEEFRSIGTGSIANVSWGKNSDLFMIQGSLVYRIESAEFFTRSLYSKALSIGSVIGKIPFDFDSNFDEFWISPDGTKMLIGKGGRNIFLVFLQADDYLSTGKVESLPYLYLPRNTRVKRVLWSATDSIVLLTGSIEEGVTKTTVFRLDLSSSSQNYKFIETADTGVEDLVLSPDETMVAVVKNDGVTLRNYITWADQTTFTIREPQNVLWRSPTQLIIAGAYIIESIDLSTGNTTTVCLSQPGSYGFSQDDDSPTVVSDDQTFVYGADGVLSRHNPVTLRKTSLSSATYRVYLEDNSIGAYANMVMVRQVTGFGTNPLFPLPKIHYEPMPTTGGPVDFENFTHGSRTRAREVSLVFNAIDSVEGLTEVLNTLAEYGLKCTFFVNGEFMRRHPGAVKEIADSGQEVGSLFFSYFDMTSDNYEIDSGFIKQGLAQNEDEYYAITGKELTLLWHAPYYFTDSQLIKASREMNYVYVGRDVDPLDWVTSSDVTMSAFYMPAAALVERIMKLKKPGSIIPIRIGKTTPGREDYLFQDLDVLINGLLEQGYSIVPVSVLMDHAR